MIVIRLKGGLGNQMFQYATALRLAETRKVPLYIDNSWFETAKDIDVPREYELDCFAFKPRFINSNRFVIIDPSEKQSLKRKVYLHTKAIQKKKLLHFQEQGEQFHKEVLWLPDNVLLEGFWQSENYFISIRDKVINEFKINSKMSKGNQEVMDSIKKTNAISVHVRRGDYVTAKSAATVHGLMGLEYYKKAVELISKQVKKPHFFVFSDEPEWCKKNLKFSFPTTYVSHNKKGSEDMRLMMNCKHHIIANSSFSWWGAWLNPSKNKIVYAPERWFIDGNLNYKDIVPKSWTRI